jgi:hypothetical protein
LPARVRQQIGLARRGRVTIARSVPLAAGAASHAPQATPATTVVVGVRAGAAHQLWLAPGEIERLGLREGQPVQVEGQPDARVVSRVVLTSDRALPLRAAVASHGLLERLVVTLGEVVTVRGPGR